MKRNGFTLIEIIVLAVMSILAGALVPIMYRVWDDSKIDLTRDRMAALKIAIAGNPQLYQQGIRSHYGFVGDIGDLPANLDDLITDSGDWIGWNGPYLGGGFDTVTFKQDAWQNEIIYNGILVDPLVAATLRSKGPNGDRDTTDDITLEILKKDVWPTNIVKGTLNITLSTLVAKPYLGSAKVSARRGNIEEGFTCRGIEIELAPGSPILISEPVDFITGEPLPVGQITLRVEIFDNTTDCTGIVTKTENRAFFVSEGISELYANLSIRHGVE